MLSDDCPPSYLHFPIAQLGINTVSSHVSSLYPRLKHESSQSIVVVVVEVVVVVDAVVEVVEVLVVEEVVVVVGGIHEISSTGHLLEGLESQE